ncbi:MAG: PH domain-containing protein [Chloroflexaceae bacterium]|nr:PH domain-containing protein [Chloroflexaceae bacterium]
MAYLDELLGRGEQVLYIARQHLFVLLSRLIAEMMVIGVLVAAGVVSAQVFNSPSPFVSGMTDGMVLLVACAVGCIVVVISGLIDYMRWNTEQYVITDRRVIQLRGVLNKSVIDSSLDKINDVELRQTLLGRMFNFGTIEILTASDEGVNMLDRIAGPLEFKKAMLEAKHNHERGYGYLDPHVYANAYQPAPSRPDIQHTLEELATLRDRGILSIAEFEEKKRELLSRI